ncbi:hypothetical protein WN944_014541 [Citrus x changshan-huyou]|uniref:Uncharacterized protein n=1 Tax=Citrus x changshan-huyou TaxID=2935761 RepID=A0AAP0M5V3_9ROSI
MPKSWTKSVMAKLHKEVVDPRQRSYEEKDLFLRRNWILSMVKQRGPKRRLKCRHSTQSSRLNAL